MLYDAMLNTVIRQDKKKNGRHLLDRRRRGRGSVTGILSLKTVTVHTIYIPQRRSIGAGMSWSVW